MAATSEASRRAGGWLIRGSRYAAARTATASARRRSADPTHPHDPPTGRWCARRRPTSSGHEPEAATPARRAGPARGSSRRAGLVHATLARRTYRRRLGFAQGDLALSAEGSILILRSGWRFVGFGSPPPLIELIEEGWIPRPVRLHRPATPAEDKRPGPVQGASSRPGHVRDADRGRARSAVWVDGPVGLPTRASRES